MQQSLLTFYKHQLKAFRENFIKVREDFGFEAIHNMRVAIKRLRAVIILAKRLDPGLQGKRVEGNLKQLFRLSGKMRDAQVQQSLLEEYEARLNTDFGEYAAHLLNVEQKSIQKFKSYLHQHTATDFTADLEMALPALILRSVSAHIKSAMGLLIGELFHSVDCLKAQQQHDEHLHEIRRQLKQINYLLSVFDTKDPDFPKLKNTLQMLEKANHLLGNWHDHVVGVAYLSQFLKDKDTGDAGGYNQYPLLMKDILAKRHMLYLKIKEMMESYE